MREHELVGAHARRHWRRGRQEVANAPDLVRRDFNPTGPDRLWAADVTQIRTGEGWLYLAAVLDLWSRKVVGWSMGAAVNADLVSDALLMAFERRRPDRRVVHHSERGAAYTSLAFSKRIIDLDFDQSLGRTGDCYDKDVVSYCTSLCWLSQNSPAETAALPFDESGITGRRWVEEPGVAVIGLVTTEHAGSVPGLDGGRAHSEKKGDLGNGEFAGGAKSVAPARELAVAA